MHIEAVTNVLALPFYLTDCHFESNAAVARQAVGGLGGACYFNGNVVLMIECTFQGANQFISLVDSSRTAVYQGLARPGCN